MDIEYFLNSLNSFENPPSFDYFQAVISNENLPKHSSCAFVFP